MTHITIKREKLERVLEEREKLERVLEDLEVLIMKHYELTGEVLHKETYAVLEEALAQPPQRAWVGLTNEEIEAIPSSKWTHSPATLNGFARAIETKLKEKNT